MYEYKFEKIKISAISGNPRDDYEKLIHNYASEGWRLHTFAPLPFAAGGQALGIQLIFEKKMDQR